MATYGHVRPVRHDARRDAAFTRKLTTQRCYEMRPAQDHDDSTRRYKVSHVS